MDDEIHHHCGVALLRLLKPVEYYIHKYKTSIYGLKNLYVLMEKQRNRGQDGAGIACVKMDLEVGHKFIECVKSNAQDPIKDVMEKCEKSALKKLNELDDNLKLNGKVIKHAVPFTGEVFLGHIRYGTANDNSIENCHPIYHESNWMSRNLVIAGNFNLTNVDELFNELLALGQNPREKSDTVLLTENISHFLEKENNELLMKYNAKVKSIQECMHLIAKNINLPKILRKAASKWDGGYCICGILGNGDCFVLRDPCGIRPGFYYQNHEIFVVASERPVIQSVFNCKSNEVYEIKPGHMMVMKRNGRLITEKVLHSNHIKQCSFERIYFSRGGDASIYRERLSLGENLFNDIYRLVKGRIDDCVLSFVPSTSELSYYGLLNAFNNFINKEKFKELKKHDFKTSDEETQKILNRKVRTEKVLFKDAKIRTFIQEDKSRLFLVSHAYDVTYDCIKESDILIIVDDSIVRGTTIKNSILKKLEVLKPELIIFASSAPQIRYPDCYGIDIANLTDLIAFKAAVELLKENNITHVLDDVYARCKIQAEEHVHTTANSILNKNHVKDVYSPFTYEQISNKIAELLTPPDLNPKVGIKVVYQTLDGLHKSLNSSPEIGDWYFSGDYPTQGGIKCVSRAFVNFYEGRLHERAYGVINNHVGKSIFIIGSENRKEEHILCYNLSKFNGVFCVWYYGVNGGCEINAYINGKRIKNYFFDAHDDAFEDSDSADPCHSIAHTNNCKHSPQDLDSNRHIKNNKNIAKFCIINGIDLVYLGDNSSHKNSNLSFLLRKQGILVFDASLSALGVYGESEKEKRNLIEEVNFGLEKNNSEDVVTSENTHSSLLSCTSSFPACKINEIKSKTSREISVSVIYDGFTFILLLPVYIYKHVLDNGKGAAVDEGVGAVCPAPFVGRRLKSRIEEEVVGKIIENFSRKDVNVMGAFTVKVLISNLQEESENAWNKIYDDVKVKDFSSSRASAAQSETKEDNFRGVESSEAFDKSRNKGKSCCSSRAEPKNFSESSFSQSKESSFSQSKESSFSQSMPRTEEEQLDFLKNDNLPQEARSQQSKISEQVNSNLLCATREEREAEKITLLDICEGIGSLELCVLCCLIKTDFFSLLIAASSQTLKTIHPLKFVENRYALSICICSSGYPDVCTIGYTVKGIQNAEKVPKTHVFHLCTKIMKKKQFDSCDDELSVETNGARVFAVVSTASSISEARKRVYVAARSIQFVGLFYRKDIGSEFTSDSRTIRVLDASYNTNLNSSDIGALHNTAHDVGYKCFNKYNNFESSKTVKNFISRSKDDDTMDRRMTYDNAGVDVDSNSAVHDAIQKLAKNFSVIKSGCSPLNGNRCYLCDINAFSVSDSSSSVSSSLKGLSPCSDSAPFSFSDSLILVCSSSGVGTKLKIAAAVGDFENVGFDLVAMCVNDIVCSGAQPVFFSDYLAAGKLEVAKCFKIGEGIARACKEAGCAFFSGEKAELPGVVFSDEVILAAFAVGAISKKDEDVLKKNKIIDGDILIGISSNGAHANGYSLIRKIMTKLGIGYEATAPFHTTRSLADVLLSPSRLYVKSLLPLLRKGLVKAATHISKGGLYKNVKKITPKNFIAEIDCCLWELPHLFRWIMEKGHVEPLEMANTFNCGLGIVLCVSAENVNCVLNELRDSGEEVCVIGKFIEKQKHNHQSNIIRNQANIDNNVLNDENDINDNTYFYNFSNTSIARNSDKIDLNEVYFINVEYGWLKGNDKMLMAIAGSDCCYLGEENLKKNKICVLISQFNAILYTLIEKAKRIEYPAQISLIVTINNVRIPDIEALCSPMKHPVVLNLNEDDENFELILEENLRKEKIEYLCIATSMKNSFSFNFLTKYSGRIIKMHPSLLPCFPTGDPFKQIINIGVRIAGCTTFFLIAKESEKHKKEVTGSTDYSYDNENTKMEVAAAIILQKSIEVRQEDTEDSLAERVLIHCECPAFTETIALVCDNSVSIGVKDTKCVIIS